MMAEWKRNDNKVAYDYNYTKEHYDRINLQLPKGYKDLIKNAAADRGLSINQLLKQLIDEGLSN